MSCNICAIDENVFEEGHLFLSRIPFIKRSHSESEDVFRKGIKIRMGQDKNCFLDWKIECFTPIFKLLAGRLNGDFLKGFGFLFRRRRRGKGWGGRRRLCLFFWGGFFFGFWRGSRLGSVGFRRGFHFF